MDEYPFEEYKSSLFTDYVMQLFNAHLSSDSQESLNLLIKSFEKDAEDNEAFFPGLVFGCMVHMMLMVQIIANQENIEPEQVMNKYTMFYQNQRKKLAKMMGNRPEYAKDLIDFLNSIDKN